MILTIDEAIRHCEEVAEENEKEFRLCPYPSQECSGSQDCRCLENGESKGCLKCAAEHKQLADWMKELKELREQKPCDDAVSRKWLLECVNEGWIKFDTEKDENRFIHLVRDIAPSVQAEKVNCSEKPNNSKLKRVFKKLVKDKKGYYSIIYEKDGEEHEGYSSFSLDVISDFLKEYFLPEPKHPDSGFASCENPENTHVRNTDDRILAENYMIKDAFIAGFTKGAREVNAKIIHCKDCKHFWTHRCMDSMPTQWCDLNQTFYDPERDYCSLAERREDDSKH